MSWSTRLAQRPHWTNVTFGDVVELKQGLCFNKKTNHLIADEGMPILRITDLINNTERKFVDADKVPHRFVAEPKDIIYTRTGQVGLVFRGKNGVVHNNCFRIIPVKGVSRNYVYWYLRQQEVIEYARSLASGAAQPDLSHTAFKSIPFQYPSLQTQDRIASILSSYDDLIENNQRRIQLLEQSARLLYKEWFVHLRFPGHPHVIITDGLPEGWERRTVADVCTSFEDGDWIESKNQGGEDFRLLQISNIGDNEFVETGNFRYITYETFRNLRCNEVVPGDTLISRMPKPIGRAWYVCEQPWRMITAVDVTIARPNPDIVNPFYYLYHLNSPTHIARCELRATGATRPRISRRNMGALPILKPPMSLQRTFGEFASAVITQRNALLQQKERLAQARDLLLPRLMNGEIAV